MRRSAPLQALLISFLLLPAASSAATYIYTGPNYPASAITSTGTPAYTASMHLSGSITTTHPLPANYGGDIKPLIQSYSFYDGLHTYTQANSYIFQILADTDASGQITDFSFYISNPGSPYSVGEPINLLSVDSSALLNVVSQTPCLGISTQGTYCTEVVDQGVSAVNLGNGQNFGSFTLSATATAAALSPLGLVLLVALTIAAPALPRFGLTLLAALSAAIGAVRRRRKIALIARRR